MFNDRDHLSERELLLVSDGELPEYRRPAVESHLASCWDCRTRFRELNATMADFVEARNAAANQMPPADAARQSLQSRLEHLAARQNVRPSREGHSLKLAAAVALFFLTITGAMVWLVSGRGAEAGTRQQAVQALPDRRLTPGAVNPVSTSTICSISLAETARVVPAATARQVFQAYGIRNPKPRAYEVDYLITPALGGSDTIQNFWPQPYNDTDWNAHLKDALEDHLRELVCSGQVDLATAQRDIAENWIQAYRKYFHTDKPIPQHAAYLKDQPWE